MEQPPVNPDAPIPLIAKGEVVAEPTPAPQTPVVAPVAPPVPTKATKGSWGGAIGIVLIVFLIVLAAFYSWGERLTLEEAATVEASE